MIALLTVLLAQWVGPEAPAIWVSPPPYTAPYSGAAPRQRDGKFADTVSVKDFGTVGDGVTNDAAAIQACLNAAVGGRCYVPPGTYNLGSTGLTMATGFSGQFLECSVTSGTQFLYTGSGTVLTIGSAAGETQNIAIKHCQFTMNNAGAGANAISMTRVTRAIIENVYVTGRTAAPDLGTGISIQGTGGYTGSVVLDRVWVTGNYTKGIYCDGPGTNSCNHMMFKDVEVARTTLRPGGTIGIHWGAAGGDGSLENSDVFGYDTAYQIDGGYLWGQARGEQNALEVAFGAASHHNTIWFSGFSDLAKATYAGGQAFNSFIEQQGLQSNVNNGSVFSTFALTEAADLKLEVQLRAGSTAEQQENIIFNDRANTTKWRFGKNSNGALYMDDGTRTRFLMSGGTPDDTDLRSAGTGAVLLNVTNAGGTGGTKFGDGAGNIKTTIDSAGRITVGTGMGANGSGLKHQRFGTLCSTAAAVGATCNNTLTWTTTFADTSYTWVCQGSGLSTGVPVLSGVSKLAASVTVSTVAMTAAVAQFASIDCVAMHD